MSRGKHSVRAEARRTDAEIADTIETYRRTVAKQAKEVESLAARLATLERQHASEVRTLRAQLREGASDELLAANALIAKLIEERDAARTAAARTQEAQSRSMLAALDFMQAHGVPREQGMGILAGNKVIDFDNTAKHGVSKAGVIRIAQARGQLKAGPQA